MSNRKTITEFLGKLLYEEKLCGMGMYWAKEVVVDYGSSKAKTKRIDFMQYIPDGQCSISSLEKGIFICYEVKAAKKMFTAETDLIFRREKLYCYNVRVRQRVIDRY